LGAAQGSQGVSSGPRVELCFGLGVFLDRGGLKKSGPGLNSDKISLTIVKNDMFLCKIQKNHIKWCIWP